MKKSSEQRLAEPEAKSGIVREPKDERPASKASRRSCQRRSFANIRAAVERIEFRAEARLLTRTRDYLDRGRPLAGLPAEELNAQFAGFHRAAMADEDVRDDDVTDLCTEIELRGIKPPM